MIMKKGDEEKPCDAFSNPTRFEVETWEIDFLWEVGVSVFDFWVWWDICWYWCGSGFMGGCIRGVAERGGVSWLFLRVRDLNPVRWRRALSRGMYFTCSSPSSLCLTVGMLRWGASSQVITSTQAHLNGSWASSSVVAPSGSGQVSLITSPPLLE